jgi:hypothetical protein
VGIDSMLVRASELGGVCTVTCPEHGGTEVHALLPIPSLDLVTAATPVEKTGTISRSLGTPGP